MALRENPFGELKVPLAWTAGVALVVALVVALALLFFFWVIPRLEKRLRIAAWLGRQTALWLIPVALAGMVWLAVGGAAQIGSQIDAYLGKTPTIDIAAGKSVLHF